MKEWTVLFYAAGNNELEPEINKCFYDLTFAGSNQDINIIIQIGRGDRKMVNILRPGQCFCVEDCDWTGVRRYEIGQNEGRMIFDMGNINMADPLMLFDFISWGMVQYPAKHYMVVLSGHGSSFIGALTDYGQELPYIMGTANMCEAVVLASIQTKRCIDILILDMCYMNSVEIMYELAREDYSAVKNVITYIEEGPFGGIPCRELISCVKEKARDFNIYDMCKYIVSSMSLDLVCVEVDYKKLKIIKDISNSIANCYLTRRGELKLSAYELVTTFNQDLPWYNLIMSFCESIENIIICYKINNSTKKSILNIISMSLSELSSLYCTLRFAKNNKWVYLLSDTAIMNTVLNFEMKPIALTPKAIYILLMAINSNLDEKMGYKIINQLISYNNWIWNKI